MNHPFLQDLCAALVLSFGHFLWIGMLIAVVAAVVARRQTTAANRYRAWLSGLIAMAASPFVTLVVLMAMPSVDAVPASTSAALVGEPVDATTHGDAADDARRMDALVRPLPDGERVGDGKQHRDVSEDGRTRASILQGGRAANGSTERLPRAADAVQREPFWWREYAPILTSLYLIGVALMGLRLAFGLWGGRRLRNQATLITERSLLDALQRQADALGMTLVPALAYCERVAVPTVLGILKPMILLPVSLASGLAPDQIESVLAHELAHLRRYDHLVNLMQCVIESVLFFHPAVWWVSRRVRDEREHCCDDLVIACGAVPLDYAASLLRVAELSREAEQRGHSQRRSFTAVSLFATGDRPSTLRQRIARLLGYQTELNVRAVHPWVLFCLATCCLGAIWLLSSMTWIVLAEINRDRSQKTVIVEWSAIVDDSVMNEIRAINGLATQETGSMQTPDDAKFSTLSCSAEELRAILRKHADNKRLVTLQKTIRHSMPTGGWRIGGDKRFFQMIDSEMIPSTVVHDPGYHVNWHADGHEIRDEDSDRATLIVDGKYHFTQQGDFPELDAKDAKVSAAAPKQFSGTAASEVKVKFDSVMSDGDATLVVLSPSAVIRSYQELVTDDKGTRFESKNKQAPRLHAIFVHEAVRVPVKQLDQFHKLTRVEDWVRRGPGETKVHVTRVAEWQARPSRSVSATDDKWSRDLPNGGHVQLVGLGRPNEARMIWWTPEGEPLSQVSDMLGQSLSGMELAVIVRIWEDGVSRKQPPPKGMVHSGGVMDVPDTFPSKGSQLLVFPAVLDKATGKMSLKIGAGFGAWTAETKIGATAESTATLNGIEVKTGSSHESHTFGPAGPPNFIKATSTWIHWPPTSDFEFSAIAVNRAGGMFPPTADPIVAANEQRHGAQFFTHPLPQADIQHFLIKSRPVHWTEFTDFAIEPAVALVPSLNFPKRHIAQLPGGVSIEFIGLKTMTEADMPQQWWSPAGVTLRESPQLEPQHRNGWRIGNEELRRTMLHVRGANRMAIRTNMSGSSLDQKLASGEQIVSWSGALEKDPTKKTATVRVGIATEPLSPVRVLDANGKRQAATKDSPVDHIAEDIAIIEVASLNGGQKEVEGKQVSVVMSRLIYKTPTAWRQPDIQIVAIDKSGQKHFTSGGAGRFPTAATSKSTGMAQGEIYFPLPPDQIDRFEYQFRLFRHWVTFEGIAWNSGEMTNLVVSTDSLPAPKPEHYVANLSDGLTVEFVGVTKNTAPANEGWKPDGTPIGDVGYWPATTYISGNTIGTFTENGEHPEPNVGAIDFLFRFRGLKAQPSFAFELAANGGSYSHWPVKDPYELRVAAQRRGPSPLGSKWSIPDGEMRIGVTDEPWGRYVKISPEGKTLNPIQPDELHASTYGRIEVLGTRPHDRAPTGNTVVLRSPLTDADSPADNKGSPDLLHRYAFEFRAIDTEGKSHWADAWLTSQVTNTKLKESQYGLMQPLPEGATLSHYEYRLRPYRHWVTFTGVSLEPGKESEVKVKVESLPAEKVNVRQAEASLPAGASEPTAMRRLVGRVVDERDQPIHEATVWWHVGYDSKSGGVRTISGRTNSTGHFEIATPASMKRQGATEHFNLVWAFAPGRQFVSDHAFHGLVDEPTANGLVLRLPEAGDMAYRVVDSAGRPVEGAVVEPWYVRAPQQVFDAPPAELRALAGGKTDATGRVRLPSLPRKGLQSVQVTAKGFGIQTQRLDLPEALVDPNTITLRKTGSVIGRITVPDPRLMRGVRLF
ncbi:MAG: M56 family metallopeptidase [Planctomycetales bacterium]|nr:M56 family metallopeptidase [Planctomycetales bacterium]